MKTALILVLGACMLTGCFALDNGLALTPQMGFNTWNHFHCDISEDLIKATADIMVATGLKAAGYDYLNLDDCWHERERAADGHVLADAKKFPSGMKSLGDYIHGKGLKFGIYSDAGLKTCAGYPGSLGYEKLDAETYASWGVDYLKYDNCNDNGTKPEIRYPPMRDALNATSRHIFFSMCEWGVDKPWTWASTVGNSWRTTGDISANWKSVMNILDQNVGLAKYAGPGHWNDPDMLEVGNDGLTDVEGRTHFSLWALLKAPLLIGCDLRNMSPETYTTLTNTEVIAVSQDAKGVQGDLIHRDSDKHFDIWAGALDNNDRVVLLLNRDDSSHQTITVTFDMIGSTKDSSFNVRDLWAHKNMGAFTGSFSATVAPHDMMMVRLSPTQGARACPFWRPKPPVEFIVNPIALRDAATEEQTVDVNRINID
eukprot:GFYU01005047.1.p2 GENE.GFYU01005047.1~~GFYU01005047.1.p2  ORF type:complete len:436 (+),score=142.88 GFYU01005047.1:30-1310(+)